MHIFCIGSSGACLTPSYTFVCDSFCTARECATPHAQGSSDSGWRCATDKAGLLIWLVQTQFKACKVAGVYLHWVSAFFLVTKSLENRPARDQFLDDYMESQNGVKSDKIRQSRPVIGGRSQYSVFIQFSLCENLWNTGPSLAGFLSVSGQLKSLLPPCVRVPRHVHSLCRSPAMYLSLGMSCLRFDIGECCNWGRSLSSGAVSGMLVL